MTLCDARRHSRSDCSARLTASPLAEHDSASNAVPASARWRSTALDWRSSRDRMFRETPTAVNRRVGESVAAIGGRAPVGLRLI